MKIRRHSGRGVVQLWVQICATKTKGCRRPSADCNRAVPTNLLARTETSNRNLHCL